MRERTGQILKLVCLVLAAALLFRLAQTALRINPLAKVTIPALPSLASDTNATAGTPASGPARPSTNAPRNEMGSNSVAARSSKEKGTNLVSGEMTKAGATNTVSGATNSAGLLTPPAGAGENVIQRTNESSALPNAPVVVTVSETAKPETNSATLAGASPSSTNLPTVSVTNTSVHAGSETGAPNPGGTNAASAGTNSVSQAKSKSKGTNSPAPPTMAMGGMNPSSMRSGGGRSGAPELPPEIKARVDRIYESEIFGQIIRPQPMALQGIAGNSAFLRSPSGQTGLVKEGDSLGEIKLLKIGINRVLVEQDGKKTELTIFNGYGSESLMPKDKETSK